jgi:hypothetical protein
MWRILAYVVWFVLMAGLGVVLGCYIHGERVNQTTVMSGVAFVRELPYGERMVGIIETTVFSYQEQKHLEDYLDKHKGQIQIDPKVLEKHKQLYRGSGGKQ